MVHIFDVLIVGDARFQGGTTAAMAADVAGFSALGLNIGLMFVRSAYLHDSRDPPNPDALALADLPGVTRLAPGTAARAQIAFLHHPLVFFSGIEERASLTAERAMLVAHHAPFRADGSLEYDPMAALRQIRTRLGLKARIAPVSGTVRRQLQSFAPLVRLTSEDWPNIFDTDAWPGGPEILSGADITIGRHGRVDGLKWPATGAGIAATLPAGADVRVRVLGCPAVELARRGADLSHWEILEFGAETPVAFLHSLDVFIYHYHHDLVEAFGRTVAEAALTGRYCLLDPRLRATFGDIFDYCTPVEVDTALTRLRADPVAARHRATHASDAMRARYGLDSLGARLERLARDPGTLSRHGADTPLPRTLRKFAGLYRRAGRTV
ncbi:glycosyltransferase family 1 protein [uncultured Sulfitobacter sp.]|uniref:glycosyltransferase family 1 protein n=1 Tax=uncultured Sulfitobacter sp. TaxID=191468 RepID=UPI0026384CB1|nr:glycosyltransferase family 1 protein [uncultured Sulfitobacter sp.]